MNTYEVMPTEENLLEMLQKDVLKRNEDLVAFYHLLQAQEVNSSIAIDGRWGSGKTFFVKHMVMLIDALNPCCEMADDKRKKVTNCLSIPSGNEQTGQNGFIAIYFDAWKNDNDITPIFSIIYEIMKQLGIKYEFSDLNVFSCGTAILEIIKGWNVDKLIDRLKGEDPLSSLKEQDELDSKIRIFFQDILKERGNRLIVFIDELDRCKPSFAVKLLEQIKHYLDMDNITFVFSVNINELQHTIRNYYGNSFDACRYLDRFFNLRIGLTSVDLNLFLDDMGLGDSYFVDKLCRKFMKKYHFEMRDASRFYCQVKAAVYSATHNTNRTDLQYAYGGGRRVVLTYFVPIIIGLRMVDSSAYHEFIDGSNSQIFIDIYDSDLMTDYYIKQFLEADETTTEDESQKKYVSREDVLRRVYETVMETSYNAYGKRVGLVDFGSDPKKLAIRASNMMSPYADMDI